MILSAPAKVCVITIPRDHYQERSWKKFSMPEGLLLLPATFSQGVGTCWVEAYNPAILREALNLKDNEVVFGITPLGYQKAGFKKSLNRKRKPLDEIVEFL